jgi:hypothetical protein
MRNLFEANKKELLDFPLTDWYPAPETAVIGLEFETKSSEFAWLMPSELRDRAMGKCRDPIFPLLVD